MATQKPKVKLYSLSTCAHCNRVKKFLNDIKVDFEYQDIDLLSSEERDSVFSDIRRFNPFCTMPTLLIGDTVIIGFNETQIRQALGIK
jgi:glutaredoxin-like protein NrdH